MPETPYAIPGQESDYKITRRRNQLIADGNFGEEFARLNRQLGFSPDNKTPENITRPQETPRDYNIIKQFYDELKNAGQSDIYGANLTDEITKLTEKYDATATPSTPPSAETIQQFIANNIAPPQIPQAIKDYASGTATAMPNYQILKDIASGVTDLGNINLGTPTTIGNIDFSNLANINDVASKFGLTDVAQGKYVNPETNPMFKILFAKALEESLPALNNTMQASGRAGGGTQKLLEGKLLADLSANIYNPERQFQTAIQQYLTGQDINQGQYKTSTGEQARQFNTGLTEDARRFNTTATENARQFNKGTQMNALNTIPTYQSMEDNDKIRRLNMLSQIAGTEQNYNQSILDLPYNVQKRYNELTTPTGAVGGTTTGQVYQPDWLTSALGDVSTGLGMYRTGQQAGWWGSPTTSGSSITTPTSLSTGLNSGGSNLSLLNQEKTTPMWLRR